MELNHLDKTKHMIFQRENPKINNSQNLLFEKIVNERVTLPNFELRIEKYDNNNVTNVDDRGGTDV